MKTKKINKEICKKLQKIAASFFNEVSDNLKCVGNSFTTYDLCKLSRNKPELFGIYTDITKIKTVDFFGNEIIRKHKQFITGKEEMVCVDDFKCTFDLSNVFELLHKFEKLSGIKKMAFVIEEKNETTEIAPEAEATNITAPCIVAPICQECNLSEQPDERVPAEKIICIECKPENIPYYWNSLNSAAETYEATPAHASIDAPTFLMPYRPPKKIDATGWFDAPGVPRWRITDKGTYYLVA